MLPFLLICFGLIYLGLPSYDYYFDGLTFAIAVEKVPQGGDPAWLLHPHHLLYSPVAYMFYRAAHAVGFAVRAWLLMHILSSILAVTGLALFHRLLRKCGSASATAAAGTALLGASYTYWHFATQGETTIPTTLSVLLLMTATMSHCRGRARRQDGLYLGLIQGVGILLHQTAALYFPAGLYILWKSSSKRDRANVMATYVAVAFTVVAAAYLVCAVTILGHRSPAQTAAWAAGYFGADPRTGYRVAYESLSAVNFLIAAKAWVVSFVGYWPHALKPWGFLWFPAAALLLAGILAGAVHAVHAAAQRHGPKRQIVIAIVLFIAAHALFFTWWKPGHVRFWLLAQPAWIALAVLGLSRGLHLHGLNVSGPRLIWGLAVLAALVVGTGAFRYEASPDCNRFLPVADALERHTEPDATVIISGVGTYGALKVYVEYFSQRTPLILDWEFRDKKVPPARALKLLQKKIASLRARGSVYLLSEALDDRLDAHFKRFHGVEGGRIRRLLFSFKPRPVARLGPSLELLGL